MSGLTGWQGTPMEAGAAEALAGRITAEWGDGAWREVDDAAALMVRGGGAAVDGPVQVACQGRIHWIDGAAVDSIDQGGVARRLIDAYRRHGPGLFQRIKGSFVVVVQDQENRRVLLGLDRIGQHALYYATVDGGIVFSSGLADLLRHPGVTPDISPQALFDYVYYHHCPSPGTIYREIAKLEGGQYALFENGRLTLERYWVPAFPGQVRIDEREAGERLLELLEAAVRRDALTADETGAFLSGGLDSSTVSGLLARVHPAQCNTFSIGFPVAGYDETEYARAAASHFGTRHHEFILHPEHAVAAVTEIAGFYDEPFGNSSALPALFCGRLAVENGVRRMLAGDGGDELFAGNERYQRQLLFERYGRVPAPARGILEAALALVPPPLRDKGVFHKARRYVEQAKVPLPDRLQDYNFLHRHAAAEVFAAGFLEQVDTGEPLELLRQAYRRPDRADSLNRMLYMDWKTTLHDNDLVKVNRMCELAGVEVCYPMLDDDVVAFSVEVPSDLKMKEGRLRGFFKDAVETFLPDKIINKSKHGFGLPFGVWLSDFQPLRELAYDSIASLKGRGYFNPEFLDHAVEMHRTIHAAYYGELIWILMMLEQWFQQRTDGR